MHVLYELDLTELSDKTYRLIHAPVEVIVEPVSYI